MFAGLTSGAKAPWFGWLIAGLKPPPPKNRSLNLPLALLVLRVLANYPHYAAAMNHFALIANLFY
jgi:hypothetical protein